MREGEADKELAGSHIPVLPREYPAPRGFVILIRFKKSRIRFFLIVFFQDLQGALPP